jgi:hypothetical protein
LTIESKIFLPAKPAPAPANALVSVFASLEVSPDALPAVFARVGLAAPVSFVVMLEPAAGRPAEPPSVGLLVEPPNGPADPLIALVRALDGRVAMLGLEVNAGAP